MVSWATNPDDDAGDESAGVFHLLFEFFVQFSCSVSGPPQFPFHCLSLLPLLNFQTIRCSTPLGFIVFALIYSPQCEISCPPSPPSWLFHFILIFAQPLNEYQESKSLRYAKHHIAVNESEAPTQQKELRLV